MTIKYKIVKEVHMTDEYTGISYGIAVYDSTAEVESGLLKYIGDVSCDKEEVEELVRMCNQLELSDVHIYDVVEDFLIK